MSGSAEPKLVYGVQSATWLKSDVVLKYIVSLVSLQLEESKTKLKC